MPIQASQNLYIILQQKNNRVKLQTQTKTQTLNDENCKYDLYRLPGFNVLFAKLKVIPESLKTNKIQQNKKKKKKISEKSKKLSSKKKSSKSEKSLDREPKAPSKVPVPRNKNTIITITKKRQQLEPQSESDWTVSKTDDQLRQWCLVSGLPTAPRSVADALGLNRGQMSSACDPFMLFQNKTDLLTFVQSKKKAAQHDGALQAAVFVNSPPTLTIDTPMIILLDLVMRYYVYTKMNLNWSQLNVPTPTPSSFKSQVRNSRKRTGKSQPNNIKSKCVGVVCGPNAPPGAWESGCCFPFAAFEKQAGLTTWTELKTEITASKLPPLVQQEIITQYKEEEQRTQQNIRDYNLDSTAQVFLARFASVMGKVTQSLWDPLVRLFKRAWEKDDGKDGSMVNYSSKRSSGRNKTQKGGASSSSSSSSWFSQKATDLAATVSKTGSYIWSGAKKLTSAAFNLIASASKWLFKQGIDLFNYIMKHPLIGSIVTYIILSIRKNICRRLSLELGMKRTRERTDMTRSIPVSSSLLQIDREMALREGPLIIQKYMDSQIFVEYLKTIAKSVTGLGTSLVSGLQSIPGIGSVVSGINYVFTTAIDILMESAKESLSILLSAVGGTGIFNNIIEILDWRTCLVYPVVDEQNNLLDASLNYNFEEGVVKSSN